MRLRHLLLTIAVPLAAAPVGALAATVTGSADGGKVPIRHATFRGAPGEANDVTVSRVSPSGDLRFSDAGASVSASGDCHQVAPDEVTCPGGHSASVYLADADDRVRTGDAAVHAEGGPGDDLLIGGAFAETLVGGAGNDAIEGHGRADTLYGGDGTDRIDAGPSDDTVAGDFVDHGQAATPNRDVLMGGEGHDVVSYTGHAVPVRVDLSRPESLAGAQGENDEISGFEGARGGSARNELIGNDANNILDLSSGGGVAIAASGNDIIGVGTANAVASIDAVVDAGPGHDRINAYYSTGARIACGPDFDFVVGWRLGTLASDCETIEPVDWADIDDPVLRPHPRLRDGRAVFRIPCPEDINSRGPCRGRLLLRDPAGRTVGKRRFELREGVRRGVGIALDRAARKRMARSGGLEVRINLLLAHSFHERESGEWSVVLAGQ